MKNAFTLLELTLVMVIIGVLLTTIISNGAKFIDRARFQATVREMGSIAEAAMDYYNSSLGDTYMTQADKSNPFGYSYQLAFKNNMFTVSTTIPKGILIDPNEGSFLIVTPGATGDQISITRSMPNEFSGRLIYDLLYLYK
ncbi:MAG: type II secretion system protein [Candidatus Omnitrophica bacterium]|nr:type II secretion system protein [Candidatus Omnitrophota bacterium]